MAIESNDPRLTAYALGELPAEEAVRFEAELGESPDGQRALAEIRATAELLRQALAAEPAPEPATALTPAVRAQIFAAAAETNGAPATDLRDATAHGATVVSSSRVFKKLRPTRPKTRRVAWFRRRPRTIAIAGLLIAVAAVALIYPAVRSAREAAIASVAQNHLSQSGSAWYMTGDVQYDPAGSHPRTGREFAPSDPQPRQRRGYYITRGPRDESHDESLIQAFGGARDHKVQEIRTRLSDGGQTPMPATFGGGSYGAGGQLPTDANANGYLAVPEGRVDHLDQYFDSRMPGDGSRLNIGVGLNKKKDLFTADIDLPGLQDPNGNGHVGLDLRGAPLAADGEGKRLAQESRGEAFNTEAYDAIVENAFQLVAQQPLSTFSIDVDTASYSNVRRFLNAGSLPPPGAVRIEELVNYFRYDYAAPSEKDADPFAAHTEVVACPWAPEHRLVRIGLKGREMDIQNRPPSNLVFLIDVSGSMRDPNKLPLVKEGLRLLVEKLGENDRVAIVVYAGASGMVLPSTTGVEKQQIMDAIDRLEAGGSTNGASGIQLAYDVAVSHFVKGGANRVMLLTDGDFNVGVTDQSQLVGLIEGKAKSGVFLSVLGFGMGNYKDSTLEKLADKGNGNYAYIDSLTEARKVLVEQLSGTLVTIAKDVKIQIEFNPAKVLAYRLIGYENRILAKEDFNDDKKDAGEIGAGHTVTALYEVVPAGAPMPAAAPPVDKLEYQGEAQANDAAAKSNDLLTLKLRYKEPDGEVSKLLKFPVADSDRGIAQAGDDAQFAAAVAGFGMLLRGSAHKGTATYDMVLELAQSGRGTDNEGYRREFIELVKKAQKLGK